MKTDSRARYQGYTFFFKEGFCWNNLLNPNARLLKAKLKAASINDVGSMSLSSLVQTIPNYYLLAILNSEFAFEYYRDFINCTVNIQINDIRQIPVIIPTPKELSAIIAIVQNILNIKKRMTLTNGNEYYKYLDELEYKLNHNINRLYAI